MPLVTRRIIMQTTFKSWIATLSLAALLTGCGKQSGESATGKTKDDFPRADPPAVSDCEPGLRGGRLVVATFGDPKTFNPMTENESSSRDIIRFMFSGLTDFDWPTQTAKPGLAHAWQAEADQKSWTFKLRRGLRCSDCQPLTADDVVFTFNDVLYNTNIVNVTVDLYRIDGKDFTVTKVDDSTVRIVTPDIYAPFVEYIGGV